MGLLSLVSPSLSSQSPPDSPMLSEVVPHDDVSAAKSFAPPARDVAGCGLQSSPWRDGGTVYFSHAPVSEDALDTPGRSNAVTMRTSTCSSSREFSAEGSKEALLPATILLGLILSIIAVPLKFSAFSLLPFHLPILQANCNLAQRLCFSNPVLPSSASVITGKDES